MLRSCFTATAIYSYRAVFIVLFSSIPALGRGNKIEVKSISRAEAFPFLLLDRVSNSAKSSGAPKLFLAPDLSVM
jgi:hypothetical protein